MAVLLCSLLIANRYGALVVSGYASREVANNDQKRVTCPDIPDRSSHQQSKVQQPQLSREFLANVFYVFFSSQNVNFPRFLIANHNRLKSRKINTL